MVLTVSMVLTILREIFSDRDRPRRRPEGESFQDPDPTLPPPLLSLLSQGGPLLFSPL